MRHDLVVRRGRWFDGTGAPSAVRDVGISGGVVAEVSDAPLDGETVIGADGCWVVPGFVDVHTHYDAEVLVNPGLGESVRHGVTTVVMGSCSLSTIYSGPEDSADLFSRVEAVPYEHVLRTLEQHRRWDDPASYVAAIEDLPLGPNVASFLGHSDLRAAVMGLGRSVDPNVEPTEAELDEMTRRLTDALDAGFLGLSTMTTKLDKVGGDRFRSRPLPSTHASWREYRRLNKALRARRRVLQSAPDVQLPLNAALFLAESRGWFRPRLRTSLLVAADAKSAPGLWRVGRAVHLHNRLLRSDVRMQHLPVPFELYADGIDLPVFEELGAGAAALHLKDEVERNRLMLDPAYRRRFRRQYARRFPPGLWHKDLHDAEIVACPDASVVGRTFGAVADERGIHPVDAFLDLLIQHGQSGLRWRTTVANHRPKPLDGLATEPGVQLGFSDAGAHLRNMAFYNFGLRFLQRVVERRFMSLEAAINRLTGELGEWFGLDAGTLRIGDRADLVIIDPAGLDAAGEYHEEPIEAFGGLRRMVRRNDDAVVATAVGGRVVFERGRFADGYGETFRTGRFLKAGHDHRTPIQEAVLT